MKAKGLFMYKSLQKREKGSFKNQDTGEIIEYDSCYVLVVDEIDNDGKITERRFKITEDNTTLLTGLSSLDAYTKIEMEFNVLIYSANAKLVPVDFTVIYS